MSISPPTPTSTEPATRAASRRLRRAGARFRNGLIGTVVVLALACAGLGVASVLQGPRIQGAQLDLSAAVSAPSPLRIVLDEAVADIDASRITVTPRTDVTAETDGDVVIVHFARPLLYDTAYTVDLAGVHAAAGGVTAELRHTFRTPVFGAARLERAASGDRIVADGAGGETQTLYTAHRIQDFLVLPGALLVVTIDGQGASVADIVATDGSHEEHLTLPGGDPGRIGLLTLAGTDVLYTFTSLDPQTPDDPDALPALDDTLFRLDLTGTHISDPVVGLDGTPLAVDGIQTIPGKTQVLLHARSADVLSYEPDAGSPPTLLAHYTQMGPLASDGHRLSVTDAFGPLFYDLGDGTETRIDPSPMAGSDAVPFIADVVPLDGGRFIERAAIPTADGLSFHVILALDDGTTATSFYEAPDGKGTILDYRLTANEQFLVAEVSPGGAFPSTSDGYEAEPRPVDVITVVIDVASGKVVAQWSGSHARW